MQANNSQLTDNTITFLGGFIGAAYHRLHESLPTPFMNINTDELTQFIVHSIVGGVIALGFKMLGAWLFQRKENKQHNTNNRNNNEE